MAVEYRNVLQNLEECARLHWLSINRALRGTITAPRRWKVFQLPSRKQPQPRP
jgi:hypothetical protein